MSGRVARAIRKIALQNATVSYGQLEEEDKKKVEASGGVNQPRVIRYFARPLKRAYKPGVIRFERRP